MKMPRTQSYPNTLKQYRKQFGYDRGTIARIIGLKKTKHLTRWEKGGALPDLKSLFKLCIVYNANPINLYGSFIGTLTAELSDAYHNGLLPTIEYPE